MILGNDMFIEIDRLTACTTIGVYDFEKDIKQQLFISLVLGVDFSKAMKSDRIEDTLDYAAISDTIKQTLEAGQYQLIEHVLGVVELILVEQFKLSNYSIEISKPSAIPFADNVCVKLNKL